MRCNGENIARAPRSARIAAVLLAASLILVGASAAAAVEIRAGTVLPDEWGLGELGLVKLQDNPTTFEVRADAGYLNINLFVYDDSVLNIYGGGIDGFVGAHDTSVVNISGGLVAADEDVEAKDNSIVNIYGGTFGDDIEAEGNAVVNIYGGVYPHATFGVQQSGQINVYLREFEILPPDGISPLERLVGQLADGSPINVGIWTDPSGLDNASINLHIVPEPSGIGLITIFAFSCLIARRGRIGFGRRRCVARVKEDRSVVWTAFAHEDEGTIVHGRAAERESFAS